VLICFLFFSLNSKLAFALPQSRQLVNGTQEQVNKRSLQIFFRKCFLLEFIAHTYVLLKIFITFSKLHVIIIILKK